jgi:uncharacterized membrane protein YeaQ/YmgE (transglycosylase-associated protein family)
MVGTHADADHVGEPSAPAALRSAYPLAWADAQRDTIRTTRDACAEECLHMTLEQLVAWIVIGGLAGIIADALISGVRLGLASAVIVGILGAFVGGWLLGVLGISLGAGLVPQIVTAVIGAVVLLLILRALKYR